MKPPGTIDMLDTRRAFDSVAADYDGPRGNNALIQDMRADMWAWLDRTFPSASRLIDLGCGTGLDAVRMARLGHEVLATDWSSQMVERTRHRARDQQLADRIATELVGAHELEKLAGDGRFDGGHVDVEVVVVDIDEYRDRADEQDGVGCGCEAERRDYDFV